MLIENFEETMKRNAENCEDMLRRRAKEELELRLRKYREADEAWLMKHAMVLDQEVEIDGAHHDGARKKIDFHATPSQSNKEVIADAATEVIDRWDDKVEIAPIRITLDSGTHTNRAISDINTSPVISPNKE